MQVVKNIFLGLFLAWFALLLFMPKQELYYKLEQTLEKNDIKINEKSLDTGLFSLTLHDSDVYVKGIKLATVEKIDFFTLLFYTNVTLENVIVDESLKNMIPTEITHAKLTHVIWNPMHVDITAEGNFGALAGDIDLSEGLLRLDFNDSKSIASLKPNLQKDEKGWYYETSF